MKRAVHYRNPELQQYVTLTIQGGLPSWPPQLCRLELDARVVRIPLVTLKSPTICPYETWSDVVYFSTTLFFLLSVF